MGLKIENVNKIYADKTVVNNISFEIKKPGVFGLLGSNGAGKTTTIRMILGILEKNSGKIEYNGKNILRENVNFGYLPEERGIYPKIKVYDQLMYFAKLKGMDKKLADTEIRKWAKILKVEEYLFMLAEKLSKGNVQKVQFITAVVHDPELIILDEPFSGLDPVNSKILKEVIGDLVQKDKIIIMSSHQMEAVEEFCDNILIMNKGVAVIQGNLKEIKKGYKPTTLEIVSEENIQDLIKSLGFEVKIKNQEKYLIGINSEEDAKKIVIRLLENNKNITKFEVMRPSLNDIFIEKVGQ